MPEKHETKAEAAERIQDEKEARDVKAADARADHAKAAAATKKAETTPEQIVKDAETKAQEIIAAANVEAQKARDDAAKLIADRKLKTAGELANKKVRIRSDRDTLLDGVITGATETENGIFYDIQTEARLFENARISPRAIEAGQFELVREV